MLLHESAQEQTGLCSLGIILAWAWDRPGAILKEPINFPSFHRPWMGFIFPQAQLTGLCGPAPSLVPPNNLVLDGERRSVNPLGRAQGCGALDHEKL